MSHQGADTYRVLMWLEYAADARTCESMTGYSVNDCIWIAHQLLQNVPGAGLDDALEKDRLYSERMNAFYARVEGGANPHTAGLH